MASRKQKFRELILYISKLSEADPRCGRTKLNKLLFYSDFRAYDYLGEPISGQTYQKREFGPTPKALLPVVDELEKEKLCVWADRTWHGKPMKRLVALREPDLSVFRPEEIDLIRNVIEEFWELDATEISKRSHEFAGWQAARLDEEIPYNTVFVDDARPLSQEEQDWAVAAIKEYRERKALAS
ncbi:MAG TPA: Panacea domain-containing protein [Thermoanaerobaculia bacterium]